ncbi:MAG: hypothetical protein ACOY0T_36815 [Myxococcota bacterium]
MHAEKVQIKLFAAADTHVEAYVPVFHRWIRENVLNELMIDVVDYSHVANGPEIVLLGHASDYVIDRGDGKLGLLYASKREPASAEGSFLPALRRALRAARLLSQEPGLKSPLSFKTDTLLVRIADRLNAPNNEETLARVEPALRNALASVYGDISARVTRVGGPRDLFSLEVSIPGAPSLNKLLG